MTSNQPTKQRIQSIDIIRGLVMLIMALDHVRDFFHSDAMIHDPTDLTTTTPILFFTRWITHFCAPAFVFLSGVSAYIAGRRKTKKELRGFLIKRGIWLVFVDLVIISFALTFSPLYNLIVMQVIWAIGFSMILLGLLTTTSVRVIVIIGFVLVFGHNIFDYIPLQQGTAGATLISMFVNGAQTFIPLGSGRVLAVFYTALPWTGVMFLGYGLGTLYNHPNAIKRKQVLFLLGLCVTILFVVVRSVNIYGDPSHWTVQKEGVYTFLSFINTTKYPPSLLYACMTIGPALILLSLTEQAENRLSKILIIYGRVPFFYYILHIFLIHTLCMILFFASGYSVKDIVDPVIPFLFRPKAFGFDLWVVYLIWLCLIVSLYWPCKWFNKYKATHAQWWLSYV